MASESAPVIVAPALANYSTYSNASKQSKCAKIIAVAIIALATVALCFAFTGWLHVILPVAVVLLPLTYCALNVFSKYLANKQSDEFPWEVLDNPEHLEAEHKEAAQVDPFTLFMSQHSSTNFSPDVVSIKENRKKIGQTSVSLEQGDILKLDQHVDVIVNTSDISMSFGTDTSGLNRAIYDAEVAANSTVIADELNEMKEKKGLLQVGTAVCTAPGSLNADHIVHVAGPSYDSENHLTDYNWLYQAYYYCLTLARNLEANSIAIPSISTADSTFPLDKAAPIAMKAIEEFLLKEKHEFVIIRIVLPTSDAMLQFTKDFSKY